MVKINVEKLNIILAQKCKSSASLRISVSSQTLAKIRHGGNVRPVTAGRIARNLGVDVTEIVEEAR